MAREFTTERETTINWSPGEAVVRIYTNVSHHIRAFRKDDAYSETHTYPANGDMLEAAQFEIERELFDPIRGRRRPRVMTDEARAVLSERMKKVAAKKGQS